MKQFVLLTVLLGLFSSLHAQSFFPPKKYPVNSFRNPLDTVISLVGNFGECRPNHFHSGIDVRTYGRENFAVRAIEDGFVSRIKVEPGGFGNAIYITHLNGYTSLYAHLNRFFPELEEYVRRRQYESKSWKQDFKLAPHEFTVRKGSFIAWSGNTGSSEGPHLHLEIRDTRTEAPLNPLLFYRHLADTKPPIIKWLAVYDGKRSLYEQTPQQLPVSQKGKIARLRQDTVKVASDLAFLGFGGDDFMEIATGTLGIFEMRMHVDGQPWFAWQMDDISYDVTRYMNAVADYKVKKNGGPWIQLCHRLPNDQLTIYRDFRDSKGLIDLRDAKPHKVKLEFFDTKGNMTLLEFYLKGGKSGNTPPCALSFAPGKINRFANALMEFTLSADALYDTICFMTSVKNSSAHYSHLYQVHYPFVPLHSSFELKLVPKASIPPALSEKLAVLRYPYKNEQGKKGKAARLMDGKVVATVRDFGDYEIVVDETAPQITSAIKNGDSIAQRKQLTFVVKEETTSVQSVTAEVDGQWLRLAQKGDQYVYELDEHFPKGRHQLTVTAVDENKNKQSKTYTLYN